MGHYARGSKQIVRIDECPVHSDRGNRIAFALRDRLIRARIYGAGAQRNGLVRHIIVRTTQRRSPGGGDAGRDAQRQGAAHAGARIARVGRIGPTASSSTSTTSLVRTWSARRRSGSTGTVMSRNRDQGSGIGIENVSFLISPTTFFQTNVGAARELVKLVVAETSGAAQVLDLYSGSGLFALPLALLGAQVTAVEENRQAIKDLEANLRLNRVPDGRVRSICVARGRCAAARPEGRVGCRHPRPASGGMLAGSAQRRLPGDEATEGGPRLLQPRGAGPGAAVKSSRPVTGRSLVQPVDMFPHTDHIETVVIVQRT